MAVADFRPFDMGGVLRNMLAVEQIEQGRAQNALAQGKYAREVAREQKLAEIMGRFYAGGQEGAPPANALRAPEIPGGGPLTLAPGGNAMVAPEPVPYRGEPLQPTEAPHDGSAPKQEPIGTAPAPRPQVSQPQQGRQPRRDNRAMIAALRRGGFWKEAADMEAAERAEAQIDLQRQQQLVTMIGKAAEEVSLDPARYPRWRAFMAQNGLDGLPETADEFVSKAAQTYAQGKAQAETVQGRIAVAQGSRETPEEAAAKARAIAEAQLPSQIALSTAKGEGKGNEFDRADKLRDEYVKQSGDFVKVRDAFGRIQASATNPSPAGDLSLIFNYMKVLDPGSTVREGEFATAQNATGVPDQVRNMFNRVLSGERLGEDQRADFVGRASMLYRQQEQFQQQLQRRYEELAQQYGIDPRGVVVDMGQGLAPPASTPTPVGRGVPTPGEVGAATRLPDGGVAVPLAPAPAVQPTAPAAPRAVNQQTGETVEWNGSAWVPVR